MEMWKNVNGYEGVYEVSNTGKIRRVDCAVFRILKPLYPSKACKPMVVLSLKGRSRRVSIASIVANAWLPNSGGFTSLIHKDGDYDNVHVSNLMWRDTTNARKVGASIKARLKPPICYNQLRADLNCISREAMAKKYLTTVYQLECWLVYYGLEKANDLTDYDKLTKYKGNGLEWREVEGARGKYLISNYGQLYSHNRASLLNREVSALNKRFTPKFSLMIDGESKSVRLDKLVAEAFVPNPNQYRHVRHLDGDPLNCRADNLVWVRTLKDTRAGFNYFENREILTKDLLEKLVISMTPQEIANYLGYSYQWVRTNLGNFNLPTNANSLDMYRYSIAVSSNSGDTSKGVACGGSSI